jgi:hypothetical protein
MADRRRTQLAVSALVVVPASAVTGVAKTPGDGAVERHAKSVVIGRGTPQSCTSATVVSAVAKGGHISFDCGPSPVTITMRQTAKVVNTAHRIVINGGGLVTLSGDGKRRILYMNTCDPKQTYTTSP